MGTQVYLQHLMVDVKNMRVKHIRKMFVYLREMSAELKLNEMKDRSNWASFEEFNNKLKTLVVQHGITLGEFATAYVLNIQSRQRVPPAEPLLQAPCVNSAANLATNNTTNSTTTASKKRKRSTSPCKKSSVAKIK